MVDVKNVRDDNDDNDDDGEVNVDFEVLPRQCPLALLPRTVLYVSCTMVIKRVVVLVAAAVAALVVVLLLLAGRRDVADSIK